VACGAYFDDAILLSKRVDLPPFIGDDPVGWLAKAKMYFVVHNTLFDKCISLAQICMEGMTWHWFKDLSASGRIFINVVNGGWWFMAESQKSAIKIWRMA